MFEELKGKKLLILGATEDETQIVRAAQKMGIYVITTDNHENWDDSPAKKISDEAWNISWSDVAALKKKAISSGVDGVIAGYSEFRTNYAIKLSKELGTHFYIEDDHQLLITRDKILFKQECRKFNVPVADDYFVSLNPTEEEINSIKFPVIIKPADNAGSRGINFCENKKDFRKYYEYALSFSESKRVVIEEQLDGHEVVVYYTIANGKATLSTITDKYTRIQRKGFNALMDAYVYPSNALNYFLKKHDKDVKKMVEGIGLKNGVISLQGFKKSDGRMKFFELGFRLGGTSTFHYTKYFNNVSHLDMLISYSLTGNMHEEELKKEDATFKGNKGCTFTLLSKPGIIGYQGGAEKLNDIPSIIHSCFYHKNGTEIKDDGSQFAKTFRAYIVGKDYESIRKTIKIIQKSIKVLDIDNKNMLFENFDPELINNNY